MSKPSVILLASKPGGVVALSVLASMGWNVRAVVTSPEFDHGEVLIAKARELGIPVLADQLELNDDADFVISYMYRKLVKRDTLDRASRQALNFHAGPLPEFGGWAYYSVAILEGSSEYGCTCHVMDESFDTGPLVSVRRFAIDPEQETAFSLEQKAQDEMIRLFVEVCLTAEEGDLPQTPQDPTRMRYLSKSDFDHLKMIPEGADMETIQRYARAFWYPPYVGAYLATPAGNVEVMPALAKEQIATILHASDVERLSGVAREALDSVVSPSS